MKTVLLCSVLILSIFSGCKTVQNPDKEAEQEMLANAAQEALKDRDFVLEADYITTKYGKNIYVNSSTNFISLKGNQATIQLALSTQYAGPNGIGGITLDGTISNEKMSKDKKGNTNYSFNVQGVALSTTVFITMYNGSNKCSATVNPNFNSQRVTFSGNLYPTAESNVFKGRAL
jgi:hypothetical protein